MSDTTPTCRLPELERADVLGGREDIGYHDDEQSSRVASDLEAVFDVPVQVSAVLGRVAHGCRRTC